MRKILSVLPGMLILIVVLLVNSDTQAQSSKKYTSKITGALSSPVLNEISGMASSRKNKNIFYVHNDSGDSSRFFAVTNSGKIIKTFWFKGDANNRYGVRDCEDIAVGPGPEKRKSYIYLADIGDNLGLRSKIQVYRFEESVLKTDKPAVINGDVFDLVYPDGPRDAETVMIDPVDKMLYIISKREDSPHIYRHSLDFNNSKNELGLCGNLSFEGNGAEKWIVSGDISADGSGIIIKTIKNVYYWKRYKNEPVYQALRRAPVKQTNYKIHGQEEAIAFSPGGEGYYITAEGSGSKIYYYSLEK